VSKKQAYHLQLYLFIVFVAFFSELKAYTDYQPIVPYLDSIHESGRSQGFIYEHVTDISLNLIGKGQFEEVELLYDSAVIFAILHDSYEFAARYLLSKSELYHITERKQEAYDALKPIEKWKVEDTVRIMHLIAKGSLLFDLKDPNLGKIELLEALNLSQRLGINWSLDLVYHELSEISTIQGDFVEAIDYALKALDNHIMNPESFHGAHIYLQLSSLFLTIGNVERARAYNDKALELSIQSKSPIVQSVAYIKRGAIFEYEGLQDSALHYYKIAHEVNSKTRFKRQSFNSIFNIATIYIEQGKLNKAEEMLFNNGKEFKDFNNPHSEWQYNLVLAKYYYAREEFDIAELRIDKYINIVEDKSRPLSLISAAKVGALISQKLNNQKKYKRLINLAHAMEDSLFQMRHSHEIYNIESKYIEKEQEEVVAEMQKENEARKKQLQIYGLVSIGLLALLSVFYILLRNNRRKSRLLKKKNEQITAVLNEKEILLKEIHHRVKNNLQIISSLLRMQSRDLNDKGAKDALKESENRIHSMAMIHQDLYQEDDLSGVDMPGYIDKLMNHVLYSFKRKDKAIDINKSVDDIKLDIDTVIPLGLILNELLTNSFKYAFNEKESGNINVELKEIENQLLLCVSDNGQKSFDDNEIQGTGFGSKMINALAKKLKAEIEIEKKDGYRINMWINEYKKVS